MRRILLDTSAYSAFLRGHPGIRKEVQQAAEIVMSPVVLGELAAGFRLGQRHRENASTLAELLASPRVGIAPIDRFTADRYAEIFAALRRSRRPIPTNDIWIAATAMQLACYVITTDRHFEHVAQVSAEVYDPP